MSPHWPKVPAGFVERMLDGHKLLGLALGAVLYLICLSGAATVFYLALQRWETPTAPEMTEVAPAALARAFDAARAAHPAARSLAVAPPTRALPRLTIAADETERVYDAAGREAGPGEHPITEGLTALHYALSLPAAFGLPLVGLAGAGLVALLVGGFAAHPRIFRDAFLWRRRAGERLALADLHNRLGVWAAPFHLTVALTGALIGLSSLLLLAWAAAFHGGDAAQASAPLLGPAPVATAGPVSGASLAQAVAHAERAHPGARVSRVAVAQAGSGREALTVTVEAPDRLVYGEVYEFDAQGRFAARHGLRDGPLGKQVYASLYKLHFGSYGGLALQAIYAGLGLGLAVICASGLDIWLVRSARQGRARPRLRKLWTGCAWAAPAAMALAAAGGLAFRTPFAPAFWGLLAAGSLGALALADQRAVARAGRAAAGAALLSVVLVHLARFGAAALTGAALWVNLVLALIGLVLVALAAKKNPLPAGGERAL